MATDDAILLHMHQGLVSKCAVGDEDEDSEPDSKSANKNKEEQGDFNGTFYDVRIKTHYFRNQR